MKRLVSILVLLSLCALAPLVCASVVMDSCHNQQVVLQTAQDLKVDEINCYLALRHGEPLSPFVFVRSGVVAAQVQGDLVSVQKFLMVEGGRLMSIQNVSTRPTWSVRCPESIINSLLLSGLSPLDAGLWTGKSGLSLLNQCEIHAVRFSGIFQAVLARTLIDVVDSISVLRSVNDFSVSSALNVVSSSVRLWAVGFRMGGFFVSDFVRIATGIGGVA